MSDQIKEPHPHDVLSGRGNYVNYHDGNEYFRKMVRDHKVDYVNCPKQQKGKFSKLIVDKIKQRNPPGRFLKQVKDSKLWYDIGEKKALDKTRQALREGAPELMQNDSPGIEDGSGHNLVQNRHSPSEQQFQNSELSILQQSIMSGNFDGSGFMSNVSPGGGGGGGMMSQNGLIAAGLSPQIMASPLYASPGMSMSNHSNSATPSSNNLMSQRFGNRTGGMNLSQVLPPPQVHQPDQNASNINSMSMMQQQQQQQQLQQQQALQQEREKLIMQQQRQEQKKQLQLLQQQQYLRQQQQQQQQQQQARRQSYTSQQQQEILLNATAVMGNNQLGMTSPQQRQQQQQPEQIHMDQLRINKLKEKQQLLQQQINEHKQLEEQLRKQQQMDQQQQNQQQQQQQQQNQQQQQQQQNPSEMQKLQSRLGEIYNTDAFLDPTPIQSNEMSGVQSSSSYQHRQQQQHNEEGSDNDSERFRTLKRENSLKMESVFDPEDTVTLTEGKKKFDASAMSMSGTSLSMGDFGEESELSALFDASMQITPGNYVVGLNDRGNRSQSNSLSPKRERVMKSSSTPSTEGNNYKDKHAALLGMSLATIGSSSGFDYSGSLKTPSTAGEKSSSSGSMNMSCDSSLSHLFEDSIKER